MNTQRRRANAGVVALLICLIVAMQAHADPAWWVARGVINPSLPAEDYGKLNLGQLKHMAAEGRNELNAFLPGGAGSAIDTLVNGWANTTGADDFAVCNLGQLKAVSKLYWDRLIAVNGATGYPWTGTADNFAAANIGQLKRVFNFESDMDHDEIPDWWEVQFTGSLTVLNGNGADADGDSLSDLAEYQLGWNPLSNDLNDAAKTESLTYDAAHRLTAVSGRSTLTYTPDSNSNITQAN